MIAQRLKRLSPPPFHSYTVYLAFLAIVVFFAIDLHGQGFTSIDNLLNILQATATISIMAVAEVFVLSTAEIDLEHRFDGGTVLCDCHAGHAVKWRRGRRSSGLGRRPCGRSAQWAARHHCGNPELSRDIGHHGDRHRANTRSVSNLEPIAVGASFQRVFGGGSIGGIGTVYLWTLGVVLVGHVIYRKTPFGVSVLATGGNRLAAGYSGIRTKRIKIQVFALSGLAASLAGLIYTGRLGGPRFNLGSWIC